MSIVKDRRVRIRPKDGIKNMFYSSPSDVGRSATNLDFLKNFGIVNFDNTVARGSLLERTLESAFQGDVSAGRILNDGTRGNNNRTASNGAGKRVTNVNNILAPLAETDGMIWPYTPSISFSQMVDYTSYAPTHTNQEFHAYARTPSPTITISGEFTAQNSQEAAYLLACIHFLRSVTKMAFGESENRGTPPPVLLLDGYGEFMFNSVPVVIQSFGVDFPNDVDYVQVPSTNTYVPSSVMINAILLVQRTPAQARTFNLQSFTSGRQFRQGGFI